MPTSVRLDADLEKRLDQLARQTGRSRAYYVREAVTAQLDEIEDIYLADQRMMELRAGRSRTYTLAEVEHELGLDD